MVDAERIADRLRRYLNGYEIELRQLRSCVSQNLQCAVSALLAAAGEEYPVRGLIFTDGLLLVKESPGPGGRWNLTGGPAVKIDMVPTRMLIHARVLLGCRGADRRPEGVVRAIVPESLPTAVWRGAMGKPLREMRLDLDDGGVLQAQEYGLSWKEGLRRLTFGLFGDVVVSAGGAHRDIGVHREILRNLGSFPADLNAGCFFQYLFASSEFHWSESDAEVSRRRIIGDLEGDIARSFAGQRFGSLDWLRQIQDARVWQRAFAQGLTYLREGMRRLEGLERVGLHSSITSIRSILIEFPLILSPFPQGTEPRGGEVGGESFGKTSRMVGAHGVLVAEIRGPWVLYWLHDGELGGSHRQDEVVRVARYAIESLFAGDEGHEIMPKAVESVRDGARVAVHVCVLWCGGGSDPMMGHSPVARTLVTGEGQQYSYEDMPLRGVLAELRRLVEYLSDLGDRLWPNCA